MAITKAVGNMYDWVTHMHTHLAGRCSHECSQANAINDCKLFEPNWM